MKSCITIHVASDIHYASDAEKKRASYESRAIGNPALRILARMHRRYIWLKEPFAHNHLLRRFLAASKDADLIVANGDYSCDSAFVGVADDAAHSSAQECLSHFHSLAGEKFHATIGDHELGKMSLFGGQGGLRITSWHRSVNELGLKPFWQLDMGRYTLLGVTSSLVTLPLQLHEAPPAEQAEWIALRDAHLKQIRQAFDSLPPTQRILLFCHDPTALNFLYEDQIIRAKLGQIDSTILGHLHSPRVLQTAMILAGMPSIPVLGNTVKRLSTSLSKARCWRKFRVLQCPSLAGLELFKDGGYWEIRLPVDSESPPGFTFHAIGR